MIPKIFFIVCDFNFVAIKREPIWDPESTEIIVMEVIQKSSFALNKCAIKPVTDEKPTIEVEVPAAFLGSKPKIRSVGTTKDPPPLPISPTRNPKTQPMIKMIIISHFLLTFPFLGFQPDKTKMAAKSVNIANRKIIGFTGNPKLSIAPNGAKITIIKANGKAILNSTNLFLEYVTKADS